MTHVIFDGKDFISVSVLAKGSNLGCYGSQRFPHYNR